MTTYRILITIPEGSDLLEPGKIVTGLPATPQAILDLIETELDFRGILDPTEGGNCTLELLQDDAKIVYDRGKSEIDQEIE